MTTQTEAQRLIEWIEGDMSCTGDKEIVAELRRLEADKDDWKDASFVFKERAVKAEEEAKRLAKINSELCATHNKRLVREARSEDRIAKLEAANAELVEALVCVLKIGRGSSGRIIIEGWQEEAIRAAIKKHGGK